MVDDEVRWRLANTVKAILDRNVDLLIDLDRIRRGKFAS